MKKSNQTVSKIPSGGEARQTNKFPMNPSVLRTAAIFLCFSVLGFFIYSNTLNGPFVFDDKVQIKYFPKDAAWIIKYNNTWGFVSTTMIMPVQEKASASNFTPYDEAPKMLSSVQINYPQEAKKIIYKAEYM